MRKRVPRLRIGVLVLVAGIIMIVVAATYVGSLAPNGRTPSCFPQSCPELGYFAILGLTGFFVVLWGGFETLIAALNRPGYLQADYPPASALIAGGGQDDEGILSKAREIHAQVKFPRRTALEGVAWQQGQPWYWCRFKRRGLSKSTIVVFSESLRGHFDQSEWKTLLTYYFLSGKPKGRQGLLFFAGLFFPFLLIPLGGILANFLYGLHGGILYGQFVAGPVALVYIVFLFPMAKRFYLKQDRWVASTMDQEVLLGLFEKIDKLQLTNVENAKKRRGLLAWLWPAPNITERIKNLSAQP